MASSSTGSSLHCPFKSTASSVFSHFSVKSKSSNGGHGRQAYATETEVQEEADDGLGGVQHSSERWSLPMVLGDQLFLFWASVVDVPSLGLLFGRDFLDGVGAVLNFNRRLLRCDRLDTGHIPLRQLAAGHVLLEIIPKKWIRPGDQKWRKFGQDGVVELQLLFSDWLKKSFWGAMQTLAKRT